VSTEVFFLLMLFFFSPLGQGVDFEKDLVYFRMHTQFWECSQVAVFQTSDPCKNDLLKCPL
jgi:hypothetical protein